MKIFTAQHAGFCEGVERAFKMALDTAQKKTNVFMLGNLVHNTQVVEKLKAAGIKIVSSVDEIDPRSGGTLLISAHGVSPQIIEKAKSLKLKVIDTTCPWVKKAQKLAHEFSHAGYFVVIIGDKGHPEVKGLKSWAGPHSAVVSSPKDTHSLGSKEKMGIISQTTQSEKNFTEIVKHLRTKAKHIKVYKTICGATTKRQQAAIEIARKVNLMLIIGDKKSANTKRLTELCRATGCETHQIQTADELKLKWLKNKKCAGVTAGASTPDWIINAVLNKIRHES
jgi:4-hydroxy-3-methylbut-2-enyl diphosphate reductase